MSRWALAALVVVISATHAGCSSAPPSENSAPPAPPSVAPASIAATAVTPTSTGIALGGNRWDENAIEVDEVVGMRYVWDCPPGGFTGRVWGTDSYATSSWICTAAVHAGFISFADGGDVVIEIRSGQEAYVGSLRNGVTSENEGPWRRSFVFVGEPVASIPGASATPTAEPVTTARSTPTGTAVAAPTMTTVPVPSPATTPVPTGTSSGQYLTSDALLICLPFDRSRFAEYDPSGNAIGVDVEIGEQIAAQLGRRAELIETLFDDLIPAIVARQCDLTIGGQFITQTRLEQIDMIPYRQGTPHVVVAEGNPLGIDELTDLCGRRFAVVGGTVFVDMVRGTGDYLGQGLDERCSNGGAPPIDLREYDSQAEAETALAEGDVDAYAGNDFITVDQPAVFDLSVELPLVRNGIGHLLGATTVDADVRAALRAMIDDGTYLDILDRYGVPGVALTVRP